VIDGKELYARKDGLDHSAVVSHAVFILGNSKFADLLVDVGKEGGVRD
jgi:hypothetical protein